MTEPEITPPPAKPKRPAEFSDEIFDTICERMTGGEWLRKICDKDPEMPSRQTFLRWIEKDTGRQAKYGAASRAMVDYWAEELLELSQETEKDTIVEKDGRRKCNYEWVANKRLHSENLRFLMSKIYPKRYGDKLPEAVEQQEITVRWKNGEDDRLSSLMKEIDGRTRSIISPVHDDNGSIINANDTAALCDRIRELEERLGMRDKPAEPPRQLTYDPGPLPASVAPELRVRFASIIQATMPGANSRSPDEVLTIALDILERALRAEFVTENAA